MKRMHWSVLTIGAALAIVLTGCAGAQSTAPLPTPLPTAAPDGTSHSSSSAGIATASVIAVPVETSNMAFAISAPVKEVTVKEGDQVKAGQTLIALDVPDLQYAVVGAEAALKSAQANADLQKYTHKTWNGSKFVSLSGPPELRQIADDQVVQAQAALDEAKAMLAQGTLTAPFDGTVVAVNVVPGELVQPGKVVAVIGSLDHMQIETTDLSERDIAGVQVGQTATVRLKAFAQDLSGKVVAIAPMGEKYNSDVVYKVTIALDSPPSNLMWGMSGNVTIQTK